MAVEEGIEFTEATLGTITQRMGRLRECFERALGEIGMIRQCLVNVFPGLKARGLHAEES